MMVLNELMTFLRMKTVPKRSDLVILQRCQDPPLTNKPHSHSSGQMKSLPVLSSDQPHSDLGITCLSFCWESDFSPTEWEAPKSEVSMALRAGAGEGEQGWMSADLPVRSGEGCGMRRAQRLCSVPRLLQGWDGFGSASSVCRGTGGLCGGLF